LEIYLFCGQFFGGIFKLPRNTAGFRKELHDPFYTSILGNKEAEAVSGK
jgi:hypothetical protein